MKLGSSISSICQVAYLTTFEFFQNEQKISETARASLIFVASNLATSCDNSVNHTSEIGVIRKRFANRKGVPFQIAVPIPGLHVPADTPNTLQAGSCPFFTLAT